MDPGGQVARSNAKKAEANNANNEWLPQFVESAPIRYPLPLVSGAAPPAVNPKAVLADATEEIVRLRNTPGSDPSKLHQLQTAWLEKAHAAGMKEPSASFSPWTASNAELGNALLFTHVGGVFPLDAVRHDGGLQFREDIFEAFALRTRGLDDAVIDSYAAEPSTQRAILERELHRLGAASQCTGKESIEDLRLRRAKLVNAVQRPEENRQLYMGLDGKVGTFDALVDYELEQRALASNPGTTLGSLTAAVAAVRGGDTGRIRAAGALGNAIQAAAAGIAPPGLGRRTRSAGGTMPRRAQGPDTQPATSSTTNATEARSRTPAGLNDKHLGGEIRNGRAVGFHHEASANGRGRLVGGTATRPDARGVYRANVEVRADDGTWVRKVALSTFFPKHWTRTEVRTAILEAYANRVDRGNGTWRGTIAGGMTIIGHSDAGGVIDSAYPELEDR